MMGLWLSFTDGTGSARRIKVEAGEFAIGRGPDNDLEVPDSRLSRRHARISTFGSSFVISDLGSSNGTDLNGRRLKESSALSDGDVVDFGGGLRVKIEIRAEDGATAATERPAVAAAAPPAPAPARKDGNENFPVVWMLVIPLFGLLAFLCAGGGYLALNGRGPQTDARVAEEDEDAGSDETRGRRESKETPGPSQSPAPPSPPVPEASSEARKVEVNASKFLQNIAINDPGAFVTAKQAETVLAKLNSIKGSSALKSNLQKARKAKGEIESEAKASGLKSQFLAAAALTKLGNSAGEPLTTAKAMIPVFADLRISLGNSLADDSLLMAADFLRREARKTPSLQAVLEGFSISDSTGTSNPREIRTIWFLKERGKLSEEYFEFAVRFLAIGAIMQNPKDFGIDAEAF